MADETGSGLPASLELVWGLRERSRRGPRPALTLALIVQAAADLADEEGLAAVSMNRLAARLGFTPMSLYRYVASKDELLTLMVDAAAGEPSTTNGADEGWRASLERFAWEQLAMLRRHPWILQVPITGPPVTPNALRWMEQCLKALAVTELSEGEKVQTVQLLFAHVLSEARLSVEIVAGPSDERGGESGDTEPPATYGQVLRRLIDAERFPALSAAVDAGVFEGPPGHEEEDAAFGLQRVLDGIEMLVERRWTSRGRS